MQQYYIKHIQNVIDYWEQCKIDIACPYDMIAHQEQLYDNCQYTWNYNDVLIYNDLETGA